MIEEINVGLVANDHTGDTLRAAFIKVNNNFNELDLSLDVLSGVTSDLALIQASLTTKSNIGHTHLISGVTGLQIALNNLVPYSIYNPQIAAINTNITDLYSLFVTNVDKTITGGTISRSNNLSSINLKNNTGGTISISSIFDTFTTGATYSNGTATFTNNSGDTYTLSGLYTGDTQTFVPYTGATKDVNLGTYDMYANRYWLYDGATDAYGQLNLADGVFQIDSSVQPLFMVENGYITVYNSAIKGSILTDLLTADRLFRLPNKTGTFALISDLAGYLPTGTTLVSTLTTGVGLSADTTSGNVTIINTAPDQTVVITGGTNVDISGTYPNFGVRVTGLTDNDTYITGGTISRTGDNSSIHLTNNSGGTITVEPIFDTYVNSGTYDSGTLTLNNNAGGQFYVTGLGTDPNVFVPYVGGTADLTLLFDIYANNYWLWDTIGGGYGQLSLTNNTFNISGPTSPIFNVGDEKLIFYNIGGSSATISNLKTNGNQIYELPAFGGQIALTNDLIQNGNITRVGNLSSINLTTALATLTISSIFDTFITGGTYNTGTLSFRNNSGNTFNVSGLYTGATDNDRYITGGTISRSGNLSSINLNSNSGVTTTVSSIFDTFSTGGTISRSGNLSSINLTNNSGNTFNVGNIFDTYTTGATKSGSVATFTNNSGGTFTLAGLTDNDTFITGGTISRSGNLSSINLTSNSGTTVSVASIFDTFSTGGTVSRVGNLSNINLTNNSGVTNTISSIFDTFVTGGTVSRSGNLSSINLTNNSGVTNIISSIFDTYTTGGTVSRVGNLSSVNLTNNSGNTFNVGNIFDTFSTGATKSGTVATFTNNSGGTFNLTGLTDNDTFVTGGTITRSGNLSSINLTNNSGVTTTVSSIFDTYTTGATQTGGIATFTNNSGGTFTLSGFPDAYTTGYTYADNLFSLQRNQGQAPLTARIDTVTGLTVARNMLTTGSTMVISGNTNTGTGTTTGTYTTIDSTLTDNSTLGSKQLRGLDIKVNGVGQLIFNTQATTVATTQTTQPTLLVNRIGSSGLSNIVFSETAQGSPGIVAGMRSDSSGEMQIGGFGTTRFLSFYTNNAEVARFATTTGNLLIGSTTDNGNKVQINGNLSLKTAGNKLNIATGTNASVGTIALVGGTATVSTTSVTANSIIMLTTQIIGGTIGTKYISARVAGTSFTISSSAPLDTSTVGYQIIN